MNILLLLSKKLGFKAGKNKVSERRQLALLILVAPMFIFTFIFKYLPMAGIILAFKKYRFDLGILNSPWCGLNNFSFFINSPDAWRITRNTIGYNLIFIVLELVVPVCIALMLYEIKNRTAIKTYQTVLFFPHFISWVVIAFMLYAFLNPQYGLINQVFKSMGIDAVDWYAKPNYWVFIIPIAETWKTLGMNTLIYYAALMGVDSEYFEAAAIEGANKFHIIIKITLPFLYPLMIMLTLLKIGSIFSADFGLFYQLPMNSVMLYETTDVLDTYVFRALKELGNISMSVAVDFYKSVVGLICVILSNLVVKKVNPDNSLF